MKRFFILTFGCQMNKSDSERIRTVFEKLDFGEVGSVDKADFVVINACSVRQTAIDRIWGLLEQFRNLKKKKKLVTILTGCLLEKDKKNLGKKFDFVFNIKELGKLRSFLSKNNLRTEKDYFQVSPKYSSRFQAFVPIMTGCNNFCSYCVVPYARGREVSRSVRSVLAEIKRLAQNGCQEVCLLGQNVNSYLPKDIGFFSKKNPFKHNFARLLWEVNQIEGIERLNFVAAHPKDMTDEVIRAMGLSKQMNYIHLALQSGDDDVLRAMNRKYTTADYFKIIKKIRQIRSDIAIGTDIIVGFPGETKKQFENTLKFYKKVGFDISFHARYSPRYGTASAKLVDNVSRLEKKKRWQAAQSLMEDITLKKNQKYLNKQVSVLIDQAGKSFVEGNSSEMKRVRVKNVDYKIGDIVQTKICEAKTWILIGE